MLPHLVGKLLARRTARLETPLEQEQEEEDQDGKDPKDVLGHQRGILAQFVNLHNTGPRAAQNEKNKNYIRRWKRGLAVFKQPELGVQISAIEWSSYPKKRANISNSDDSIDQLMYLESGHTGILMKKVLW